jgi:hypothetical protein
MKNIHVLPTDKPSRLYSFYGMLEDLSYGKTFTIGNEEIAKINLHNDLKNYQENLTKAGWKSGNIYITSDDEIKEGDWTFDGEKIYKWTEGDVEDCLYNPSAKNYKDCKKITLATDEDLIKDGVQAIDDDFLKWFVNNPSCEEIEIEVIEFEVDMELGESCIEYGSYYKVIIPKSEQKQHLIDIMREDEQLGLYEEPKKETLEEAAERLYLVIIKPILDVYDDGVSNQIGEEDINENNRESFIAGAKWQQEQDKNKYTEEEVLAVLQDYCWYRINEELDRLADVDTNTLTYIDWFEQFKKK